MSIKTFMCIRRMEEDGETEKPMHCRSVSIVDYDKAEMALKEAHDLLTEWNYGHCPSTQTEMWLNANGSFGGK